MPIPDFQSCMLPLLIAVADKQEHSNAEIYDKLAELFKLNEQERNSLLPSGRQAVYENRIGWAKSFLQHAGLIESTGRALFRITSRGEAVLAQKPVVINIRFLLQFPEFAEWRRRTDPGETTSVTENNKANSKTPYEILEESYQNLEQALVEELLNTIKACSPRFFERLVVDLLVAMGYGGSRIDAGSALGRSGDGGVDGIIKEDKLGLDVIYLQAKKWNQTVGAPEVQAFAGSLEGFRARKGVMITTSTFSQKAVEYVGRIEKRISLIDGMQLARLMIDHGIGVTEIDKFVVRRIDKDFFESEL